MRILIDADACPVVDIAIDIAVENELECILLCDTAHYFNRAGARTIVLGQGADSVDFALVNMDHKGDIVITQDYGLATLVLSKGGYAMHHSGRMYTEDNIDKLLFERFLSAKVRRNGQRTKNMKKFTEHESEQFRQELTNWIELNNRSDG